MDYWSKGKRIMGLTTGLTGKRIMKYRIKGINVINRIKGLLGYGINYGIKGIKGLLD
jgi:hypothetical protein